MKKTYVNRTTEKKEIQSVEVIQTLEYGDKVIIRNGNNNLRLDLADAEEIKKLLESAIEQFKNNYPNS